MNKENLIAKGVKHAFNGKETLFQVESLNKHFDGLVIHESDILTDEFEDQHDEYVKAGDVNFDSATPNEIKPEEEIISKPKHEINYLLHKEEDMEKSVLLKQKLIRNQINHSFRDNTFAIDVNTLPESLSKEEFYSWFEEKGKPGGMTFEEAEELLSKGELVSLPEWEGFWFKNIKKDELLVFTKDDEILDTPFDEYKLRNDWVKADPTPEQKEKLDQYFESLETNELKVVDPIIEKGESSTESNVSYTASDEHVEFRKNQETELFNSKTTDVGLPKPKEPKATTKK